MITYSTAFRFKRSISVLVMAVLLLGLLPLSAFGAAAGEPVTITLQAGSPTVTINGQATQGQKPYIANGTLMVPLGVITKAFGAGLKLESGKIITLTYNGTTVVLTIGSKTVKVNGKPSALAAEPKFVNGVTMVPLRVIATAFGATLGTVPGTKTTIIKGFRAGAAAPAGGGTPAAIDSDSGKTSVGDSYFNWSMKYPAGLAMTDQSDNGSQTVWSDATGAATVLVFVTDTTDELTRDELRDEIAKTFDEGEIILEKHTVSVGGLDYEKIVTRLRAKGFYFEYRGIQKNGHVYISAVGVKSEDKAALAPYQSLLDSFKPSFDGADSHMKDITKVKNGYMSVQDKDFGLSIQLPKDWVRNTQVSVPQFVGEDGYLTFYVNSLESGDTLDKWLQRELLLEQSSFASDYSKNVTTQTVLLPDGRAQVIRHEYTYDKKNWHTYFDVLLVKGAYRYDFVMSFDNGDGVDVDKLFQTVIGSADVDTAFVEKNFDELDDSSYGDRETRVTKTSKAYGYSVSLPAFWDGDKKDFEQDTVGYSWFAGVFTINVIDNKNNLTNREVADSVRETLMDQFSGGSGGISTPSSGTQQIAGQEAGTITFDMTDPDDDDNGGVPYRITTYVLQNKGKIILLNTLMDLARITGANNSILQDTIQSFKIN